jgi:hypothetical protein
VIKLSLFKRGDMSSRASKVRIARQTIKESRFGSGFANPLIGLQFLDPLRVTPTQGNVLYSQQMSFHPSTPIQRPIAF